MWTAFPPSEYYADSAPDLTISRQRACPHIRDRMPKKSGRSGSVPTFTMYRSMKVDGNKVRLTFNHTGGGLMIKGGDRLLGFAVAGEDKKFVWAKARIEDGKIVVSSDGVPEPVAVRYAWAANPKCNLVNEAGLPASPFTFCAMAAATDGEMRCRTES